MNELTKMSELTGVSVEQIKYGNRAKENVDTRRICCYLLREKKLTLSAVADTMNMYYTTVHYHCQRVKELIEIKDKQVMNILNKFNETTS